MSAVNILKLYMDSNTKQWLLRSYKNTPKFKQPEINFVTSGNLQLEEHYQYSIENNLNEKINATK